MPSDRRHKWLAILFFSVSGLVFGGSLYLIATGAAASSEPTTRVLASAATALPYADEPFVKITLLRDTRIRLGNLAITYRGVENDRLRLDVVVLDLDPQYAYRHAIALDEAGRGFRLAGTNLKLISARTARAKIVWDRTG
jgi:hypothetical protein